MYLRRRTYTPRLNGGGGINIRQLREEHENVLDEMKEFDRWNSFINILVVVVWVCSIVLPNIKRMFKDYNFNSRENDGGGINMRQLREEHENLPNEMNEFDRTTTVGATPRRNDGGGIIARRA
ncbi:727_t:CDS:2 [Funneliformis mosseae]|uniref:727_t:CDS:1 n=1 Tax=Funneliformis mosseae TaxID=27381 RepID=A0A9N9A430_FUNMO|nr:727_t:CDS:2 [Funneliformis mosseae]